MKNDDENVANSESSESQLFAIPTIGNPFCSASSAASKTPWPPLVPAVPMGDGAAIELCSINPMQISSWRSLSNFYHYSGHVLWLLPPSLSEVYNRGHLFVFDERLDQDTNSIGYNEHIPSQLLFFVPRFAERHKRMNISEEMSLLSGLRDAVVSTSFRTFRSAWSSIHP